MEENFLNEEVVFSQMMTIFEENGVYSIRRLDEESFYRPFTLAGTPKIYIVQDEDLSILYVGYAESSMSTRLRSGLNSTYPYRWRDRHTIQLTVFTTYFAELHVVDDQDQAELTKVLTKGLEAEIALRIKNEFDYWPLCQQEIHFTNEYRSSIAAAANFIFSSIELSNE